MELNLSRPLIQACEALGYAKPTPIQVSFASFWFYDFCFYVFVFYNLNLIFLLILLGRRLVYGWHSLEVICGEVQLLVLER